MAFNWFQFDDQIQSRIEDFCRQFVALHGDNLLSMALCGDSVTMGYMKGRPLELMAIFQNLDFQTLKKSAKLVRKGIKKDIVAPLMVTQRHIQSSCDVFPLEFLDLKSRSKTFYGEELLGSIEISSEHLRLECEQQIKGKLIRLRQAYLEVALNDKQLRELMTDSFFSFLPLFSALLVVVGDQVPPEDPQQLIAKVAEKLKLSGRHFEDLWAFARDQKKLKGAELEELYSNYLEAVYELAGKVDQL